jgi:hypothetical protein
VYIENAGFRFKVAYAIIYIIISNCSSNAKRLKQKIGRFVQNNETMTKWLLLSPQKDLKL